jgi:two-component system nitrogen regulation response regulator NtrX
MVQHFVAQFCMENGFRVKKVAKEVLARFESYEWPGNVRELKNIIERVVIMSDNVIQIEDLPPFLTINHRPAFDLQNYQSRTLREFKEEIEREFIKLKLEENDWNISRAATALGIERTNLHKKLKAYNIQKGES